MLIYKVWRESRSRFLFVLLALLLVTAASAFYNAKAERLVLETKDFHEAAVRTYRGPLFLFWGFAAVFLGLGGLLREKAIGTVDYTLSLPVTRTKWFLYRAVAGAFEAVIVAVTSALAVPLIALAAGGEYPAAEAFVHGIRLGLGGMLFYSIGLLSSVLFAGEFASAGIGVALVFAINNSTRTFQPLKNLNLQDAITPMQAINASNYLFQGPLPWLGIWISLGVSTVLWSLAWRVTTRRDF